MSYSSRNTPRSSATQGRIVTENTALSAILHDTSHGDLAPAQRTASVNSPALDVVPSNVDVVNVSNAETNNDCTPNLQYVVVSKSSSSLNTATNQEHLLFHEKSRNKSPVETESNEKSEFHKNKSENSKEFTAVSERQLNVSQTQDSARSHSYAYNSLKSQKQSDISRSGYQRGNSKSSFTGENSKSGSLHDSGDRLTKECVEVNGSGDTNQNARVNSRLNSQFDPVGKSGEDLYKVAPESSVTNIAPENSDRHLAHEKSSRQNSLHEKQQSRLIKERSRDHSFAQQHTRLSLNSQHDRVSRGRTPLRVNTQDQIVPPLDLSGVNLPEPVKLSSPKPSYSLDSIEDQNLHASDQKESLVYFSSHDYNPTSRRTYEVASPVLSSQLPHVNSSKNFRQDEEHDTFRERQQEPSRVENHRSDLADDLRVPYPFDTQAAQGDQSARELNPPSPPVQTTPPPAKEPATSLRSNSNVYAVANPEVQRAQGIEPQSDSNYIQRQYSRSEARQSAHSEVRFDAESRRPPSIGNKTYGGSPVKDRAPTPYAKSPEREELPRSPDWEVPKEEKSREQSNASRKSLPPQHPPLDTLHSSSKPGSRGTKRTQEDSQSVKRVYVESPSFTKEEEEEYRFVSSRLDDTEEHKQATVREMDNSRRGYGGDDNPANGYTERGQYRENRKMDDYGDRRRTYDKDRYEDRNQDRYEDKNQDRNGDEFYKDRYEDSHHPLSGYYAQQNNAGNRVGSDRYSDRMRENDRYQKPDRYERLRDERAEYEREQRRDDETELQQGYRKQNTEMDDKDLQKEAEYQRDLKRRIEKQNRKIKQSEKFDKENDFRRDSLEYPQDDRDIGYVQDSLEYNNYDMRQPEWENPPQNPYQSNQGYFPDGFVKQDSKPDFYDPEDVEKMDIVNPKAPKYDYVEHNKVDYGKLPQKTYRDIVHRKKEEEEKLDHIFITPKVPSKHPKRKSNKAQSAQPEHMGYQAPNQYAVGFKPSSAEELWAQRARVLSEKKGSAGSGKPAKASANKGVGRWNSNPHVKKADRFELPPPLPNQGQLFKPTGAYQPSSRQDQAQGGYGTPTRQLQPIENRPAAPVSTEMVPTAVKPSSPFRRHKELKPITQEITTEDGQRISVDINLRLISPPPGQSGPSSPSHQQLALVPVQESQLPYGDQRGFGVPYQMQDPYGNSNPYNTGYQEVSLATCTCIYILIYISGS